MTSDNEARKKTHSGLATTWRKDEVELMNALVTRLLVGGDVRQLVKHPAFASVARKFQLMRDKAERVATERVESAV